MSRVLTLSCAISLCACYAMTGTDLRGTELFQSERSGGKEQPSVGCPYQPTPLLREVRYWSSVSDMLCVYALAMPSPLLASSLCVCYAMSGTDIAYGRSSTPPTCARDTCGEVVPIRIVVCLRYEMSGTDL
eukprot:535823-Rhodomonas_salina.1